MTCRAFAHRRTEPDDLLDILSTTSCSDCSPTCKTSLQHGHSLDLSIEPRSATTTRSSNTRWVRFVPSHREVMVTRERTDLETMEVKLESNQYTSLEEFLTDAGWIFTNCRTYNAESSNYVRCPPSSLVYTSDPSQRSKTPTSSKPTSRYAMLSPLLCES